MVGLEVKREFVLGELREFKHAVLPIAAAIGGMIVPAAIYLALQAGAPGERGWGIPMATDIAFVVGCMAILGPRISNGLRIMPLFALANAGVALDFTVLRDPVSVAVMTGLFIGKPLGIFVFSWLAVKFKLARLPDGADWPVLAAGGILGGIGFTMALFIGGLALSGELLDAAKVGIMTGSALSAVVGMTLIIVLRRKAPAEAVCTLDDGGEGA